MIRTTTRPSAPRTALRALASAAVLTSGVLLLTACSSTASTTSNAGAGPSASASTREQQMAAYRQCLSEHGVTLPARPSGKPGGGTGSGTGGGTGGGFARGFGGGASADPARQKAMQACASLRPHFNGQGGGRGGFNSTAMKAFASCLKDHGVVLPSASPGGGLRGLNTADPKTAQAFQTCRALLPQRSGSPAPTASASPSA